MADKKETAGRAKDDPVVVEPRTSLVEPSIHDTVILSPVGPLAVLASKLYKAKRTIRSMDPARVYAVSDRERKISLVGPAMGAPAAVFVLERLIVHGAKRVIMLGLCGSVNSEAKVGDIVVPEWSIIEEGTSRHYMHEAKKSSPTEAALEAIQEALKNASKRYHLGPIWTTDAIFRETKAKVKSYGGRGVLAVEMEASALFTVARYRGIELGAILVVSDELFDLKWRPGFTRPRFMSACRHACHIALSAARILAGDKESEDIPLDDGANGDDIIDKEDVDD